jgi:hypothetical protein
VWVFWGVGGGGWSEGLWWVGGRVDGGDVVGEGGVAGIGLAVEVC